jgi:hypothetical protein
MHATGSYIRYTQEGHFLTADEQNLLAQAAGLLGRGLTDAEQHTVVGAIKQARPAQLSEAALRNVVAGILQQYRSQRPKRRRQNIFV